MRKEKKKETKVQENAKKGESGKYAGTILAVLFSGIVIGPVTRVLFALKKGKQTRKEILLFSKTVRSMQANSGLY